MKKILLTGCSGYVGNIIETFLQEKYPFYEKTCSRRNDDGTNFYQCDLQHYDEVRCLAKKVHPEVIVHAAGVKNLKACEEDAALAEGVNAQAFMHLIKAFGNQVKYIYISSDYVFDGTQGLYKENDEKKPTTAYGISKLHAENMGLQSTKKIFFIRACALFDKNATFPRLLRKSLQENQEIECFEDVFYSPTYFENFLMMLHVLIERENYENRVFHCGGERVSRYEFAKLFAETLGYANNLIKKSSVNNSNPFLFRDLSLDSSWSMETLKIKPFTLGEALKRMGN